jgi:hypothetical protein
LERQKFDTSSAQSVALCDVKATLIHTPLRTCAKPKSTFVTTLNSPCILWLKNGLYGFYLGIPRECAPTLSITLYFVRRFNHCRSCLASASHLLQLGSTHESTPSESALNREVWLAKTLAKTKTVCTSVGSTNVEMLCWVVILLP